MGHGVGSDGEDGTEGRCQSYSSARGDNVVNVGRDKIGLTEAFADATQEPKAVGQRSLI